jgi:hypothetical protein
MPNFLLLPTTVREVVLGLESADTVRTRNGVSAPC